MDIVIGLTGLSPGFVVLVLPIFSTISHAFAHFAEDAVLVVEVRRRAERDEELASVCIRTAVRHREDASLRVAQLGG